MIRLLLCFRVTCVLLYTFDEHCKQHCLKYINISYRHHWIEATSSSIRIDQTHLISLWSWHDAIKGRSISQISVNKEYYDPRALKKNTKILPLDAASTLQAELVFTIHKSRAMIMHFLYGPYICWFECICQQTDDETISAIYDQQGKREDVHTRLASQMKLDMLLATFAIVVLIMRTIL